MKSIKSFPKWWTEKPRQLQRYDSFKYTTKNGVEIERFTKDGKFYNENAWKRERGRALFDAQARGYGRRMGIENYRDAQKQFKQKRDNYMKAKEDINKKYGEQLTSKDEAERDNELEGLWESIAYDETAEA